MEARRHAVTRLSQATLGRAAVPYPAFDRAALRTGIVHFGPGAFHRAHQAAYVDRLLADDPRWGIAAVSLRAPETVTALRAQDGLYTLAILDAAPAFRVLGAHTAFCRPGDRAAVEGLLADPAVRLVSATVTEKGYCLAADGTLDFDHADIAADLATPNAPRSIVGWLVHGLRLRRTAGLAAFTVLSCDNMHGNGRKLGAAVAAFAGRLDPALARWIVGETRFPNTMVDAITPATDDGLRATVRARIGLDDAIPVAREAYTAWVVEDVLPDGGPDLAAAGVLMAADVAVYERAKLRILNGAHSALAYLGLLRGHETIADAMGDPELADFTERMIRDEIVPLLEGAGMDLDAYATEILARFRNPAIGHRLAQIAWDGSQKLPYRLLDTIAEARAAGRSIAGPTLAVAAWMRFVERQTRMGIALVDPLAERLAAAAREARNATNLRDNLLALHQVFPAALTTDTLFRTTLYEALTTLGEPAHA